MEVGLRHFLVILFIPLLFSFNFSPMTQTVELSKGQKSAQYQIENNTKEVIPVTVKVFQRIQNEDGTESLPATKEIRVFPPQLIIPPGDKKTIRVDWLAGSSFATEKSYRIVAEQVPLELNKKESKDKGGIKMLLKYMNALYVDPGKTKSNLRITKYSVGEKIRVYIKNKGNAHQYLKNVKIFFAKKTKLKNKKKKIYRLPSSSLKALDGQNILAGATRYFEFDKSINLPKGLEGNIKFD